MASEENIKIACLGDCKVGKSTFIEALVNHDVLYAYQGTVGLDFYKVRCEDEDVSVWDISGHEKFSSFLPNCLRDQAGFVIFFNIGDRETFDHVESWYNKAKEFNMHFKVDGQVPIALVGTHDNRTREVTYEEGRAKASALQTSCYFEVCLETMVDLAPTILKATLQQHRHRFAWSNFENIGRQRLAYLEEGQEISVDSSQDSDIFVEVELDEPQEIPHVIVPVPSERRSPHNCDFIASLFRFVKNAAIVLNCSTNTAGSSTKSFESFSH